MWVQCLLKREDKPHTLVTFIETKYVQNYRVKLKWNPYWWIIVHVYENSVRPTKPNYLKDIREHRKKTGDSQCKK